jgi:hypothetical protein
MAQRECEISQGVDSPLAGWTVVVMVANSVGRIIPAFLWRKRAIPLVVINKEE